MTYRGVNRKRLAWLVANGLTPDELKKFFKERRAPLVLSGVKAQAAPPSSDDAINQIVHFGDRANQIFADWLQALRVEQRDKYRPRLVQYVRAVEYVGLELPTEEIRQIARVGLQDLFSDEPDEAWVALLKTDIPAGSLEDGSRSDSAEPQRNAPFVATDIETMFEWLLGRVSTANIQQPTLRIAADLIEAIKCGDFDKVDTQVASDIARAALRSCHKRYLEHLAPKAGLDAIAPRVEAYDPHQSYLAKEIVAIFGSGGGPYFLDVVALLDDSGAFVLDEHDMQRALPEEGRVILHADARLGVPIPGVADTYRVERYPTARSIKCRATRHGRRLLEVAYVPFKSDERDSVRAWIVDSTPKFAGHRAPTIFVLSDGVCIKDKCEQRQLAGGAKTNWHFDFWKYLKGLQIEGRAYVPEPLPSPDGEYECAPPAAVARRYLRSLMEQKAAKYTKQQLTDLSTLVVSQDVALTQEFRSRLLGNLGALTATDDHYDEIVEELLKAPSVRDDIEKRKQEAATAVLDAMQREKEAIERLRKERTGIEASIKNLKADATKRGKEIQAAIKKSFRHAADNELETLGNLAVLKELLSIGAGNTSTEDRTTHVAAPTFISHAELEVATVLRMAGFSSEIAALINKIALCAKATGIPIIIDGLGANQLATKFGAALTESQAAVVDVPIGLLDCELTQNLLESSPDVVVYRAANQSSAAIYAAPLISKALEQFLGANNEKAVLGIFASTSGPTALPWPEELAGIAMILDLSNLDRKAKTTDRELTPIQQKMLARFERAAEAAGISVSDLEVAKSMFAAMLDIGAN